MRFWFNNEIRVEMSVLRTGVLRNSREPQQNSAGGDIDLFAASDKQLSISVQVEKFCINSLAQICISIIFYLHICLFLSVRIILWYVY